MKLIIDEKQCLKHKLSLAEVLAALFIRNSDKGHPQEVIDNLAAREVVVIHNDKTLITQRWNDVIDEILYDSSGGIDNEERLTNLAVQIMACFPQDKMKDNFGRTTPYFYKCNKREIISALKRFFNAYGNFKDDDIIDATKRYVASFQGNYTGMRLAKYFIIKQITQYDDDENPGHNTLISDLATFLENKGSGEKEVDINPDWTFKMN